MDLEGLALIMGGELASFELATPPRIVFGDGRRAELPRLVVELGVRELLVVTGKHRDRHADLVDALAKAGLGLRFYGVGGEPTVDEAREAVAGARGVDGVVAIGGGSALDLGKAVAALLANGGDPLDYLEVVGKGKKLLQPSLPFVAVPTTAGTGSEVTANAVLASTAHAVKASLRSPHMLARVALVDPELTHALPRAITAATGLDALTQVLEPFVSSKRNPITDGFAREGLRRAARSLRRAFEDGRDAAARRDLALVSLLGGLALANAKLGAAHGFAGPIGGMFASPHGAVCARLLPPVMDVNVRALRARAPSSEVLARYDEIGRLLTGREDARAEDGVAWVEALAAALEVPPLRTYGLGPDDFATVVEKARVSSSMQGNPIILETGELEEILRRAY
jgi:alcohol dehydrogenase class IV